MRVLLQIACSAGGDQGCTARWCHDLGSSLLSPAPCPQGKQREGCGNMMIAVIAAAIGPGCGATRPHRTCKAYTHCHNSPRLKRRRRSLRRWSLLLRMLPGLGWWLFVEGRASELGEGDRERERSGREAFSFSICSTCPAWGKTTQGGRQVPTQLKSIAFLACWKQRN